MSKGFITAKETLTVIQQQREDLLKKAADSLAGVLESMNAEGSSVKNVESNINKLLDGFNDSDKFEILSRATALLVVNL